MTRRNLDFSHPISGTASPKAQQLTRHLSARLGEFFTISITEIHEENAFVRINLEQFTPQEFYEKLHFRGIETISDNAVIFYLTDQHRFEDIDYVWGKLYTILV